MRIWVIILCCVTFLACVSGETEKQGDGKNSKWPAAWQDDYAVKVFENGGMMPLSWDLELKGDTATYTHWSNGNKKIVKALIPRADLDSVAMVIKANKPHKIRMKKHAVIYDKGTTGMYITCGKNNISLGDGATESFTKKGGKKFNAMYAAACRVAFRQLNKMRCNVTFRMKCTGLPGFWCHLQENGDMQSALLGCNDTTREKSFIIFPGKTAFSSYAYKSADGKYKYPAHRVNGPDLLLNIRKDTLIQLLLRDSILEVTGR